jgi:predicted transposase/invertase (TIGR01784 family)
MITYEDEIKKEGIVEGRIQGKIEVTKNLVKLGSPLETIKASANLPESLINKIIEETKNN